MYFFPLLYCLATFSVLSILCGALSCHKNITIHWFEFWFVLATADWWLILIGLAVLGLNKCFSWILSMIV